MVKVRGGRNGRRGRGSHVGVGTWVLLLLIVGGATALVAQQPTLTPADYGQWERLGAFDLDPTGSWVVTSIGRVDADGELRLHRSIGAGDPIVLAFGSGPVFSSDGRFLAYRKGVSEEEREASEGPVQSRLGLVNLAAGSDTVLFDVTAFDFRDDGLWLAALGSPASDSVGADLIVMNPATGAHTLVGNVSDFEWQDEGPLLAATLKTAWGSSNGVVVFDPEAGTLRTIESGPAEYVALTWRDESSQLAVLRTVEQVGRLEPSHDALVWADPQSEPEVLAAVGRSDLDDDLRVTDFAGVRFSDDGSTIFVGLRPWEEDPDGGEASGGDGEGDTGAANADNGADAGDGADDVPPADVQVWHWDDDQILRAQEYGAARIARQTMLAAWHLDADRLVRLGTNLDEPVRLAAGGRWGLVPEYGPYRFERRFGAGSADWYRVDTSSGARTLIARGLAFGVQSHLDHERILFYRDDAWQAASLATMEAVTLGDGRSFTQSVEDYDYPGPRPAWGLGAWSSDGSKAMLYDRNDVWVAELNTGSMRALTGGASEGLRYRVAPVEADDPFFGPLVRDEGADVWLRVMNLRTKASGYARAGWNDDPDVRIMEDARVTGLTKSRNGATWAVRMERWDDSPDVFVGGADLDDLHQVTETNPFQADFAWGRSELLDYTTDAGHDLQAILVYPANFRQGQRYPLILYQYERLSDNLHAYDVPSERDYYNYQAWSQAGYFVLMPDIVYEPGRPGPSALDAVEHALDAAVATGHVDADGMGLIGHSWGGYQAAYLPTRTNRFAASVAGAAITNFMSFMGAVHWNGGLPETGHWETGQARMAAPYWEDMEGHLESSPANFITDLETPLLLMHGDEDGVVDFYQGLEFYNYARRAGKEVLLLVYPGADHGLSDESQQVDYHRRILEWFGHHLKGESAASWITDGESWTERAKRIGN